MTEPWPSYVTTATLGGPQPGDPMCCDSCRIVARAVARLAFSLGFVTTARELYEMLEEEM